MGIHLLLRLVNVSVLQTCFRFSLVCKQSVQVPQPEMHLTFSVRNNITKAESQLLRFQTRSKMADR